MIRVAAPSSSSGHVQGHRRWARSVTVALLAALASVPSLAGAQTTGSVMEVDVATELARAERAYEDEDHATAAEAYAAVLARDPDHTRALFRLAQLRRSNPSSAIELLRRYVALVPADAWGHLALASALADAGRRVEALAAYDEALALEPDDRDIALGGPRLYARVGQPDRAIDGYRRWLATHADDGEAWRELADQLQRAQRFGGARRATERALGVAPGDQRLTARLQALRARTAPAVEASVLGIGETDVSTFGSALGADVGVGESARLGITFSNRQMWSLGDVAMAGRFVARGSVVPRSDLQVQFAGGVAWSGLQGTDLRPRPEARVRLRRRPPRGGVTADVRAQHGPVDVTPQLAIDELTRTQLSAATEVPLGGRLLARGSGRVAVMARPDERNIGLRYGGALATVLRPAVHLSGGWQQARYRDPAIGYFAPRLTDTVEAGLDMDLERGAWTFALDAGAGAQRVVKHAALATAPITPIAPRPSNGRGRGNQGRNQPQAPTTPVVDETGARWGPAFRAWGLVGRSLRPGRFLAVEFETYDSQVADAVIAAEQWRYASVTVSFRVAVR
jgi:tetratricopeptide (TPR) repeat protein